MFAIVILEGIDTHIQSKGVKSVHPSLLTLFSSVGETMLALFMAITGGLDWENLLTPLRAMSPLYTPFFCSFIVFLVLGVMNIVTAVFVESAHRVAEIDQDLVIQDELSRTNSTINEIKRIFRQADVDLSGTITKEELNEQLRSPETQAYLKTLNLDATEAQGLFTLLDMEEVGHVRIEGFVGGIATERWSKRCGSGNTDV